MRIPLGNNMVALVDDEKSYLVRYRYYVNKLPDGSVLVCRKATSGKVGRNGRRGHRLLAHDVLNLQSGRVWYVNGDRFDCRKSNLRVQAGCVIYLPQGHSRKPYRALIKVGRRQFYLGHWPSEEWARIACQNGHEVAKELRGKGLSAAAIKKTLRVAVGID